MKCKLRNEMEVVEALASEEYKAQCIRRDGSMFAPAGTILDDPNCWLLVLMGQAVPADEECEQKTARPPEVVARAEYAADRLSKGIHPDDFERYDRGELVGYDANGNEILSPEAAAKLAASEQEEE